MKDNRYLFQKILNYARQTEQYTQAMTYETFVKDSKTVAACAFAICQIAELTQHISDGDKKLYPRYYQGKLAGIVA